MTPENMVIRTGYGELFLSEGPDGSMFWAGSADLEHNRYKEAMPVYIYSVRIHI